MHPQTICLGEGREKVELLAPIIQVVSLEVLTALYFWVLRCVCAVHKLLKHECQQRSPRVGAKRRTA